MEGLLDVIADNISYGHRAPHRTVDMKRFRRIYIQIPPPITREIRMQFVATISAIARTFRQQLSDAEANLEMAARTVVWFIAASEGDEPGAVVVSLYF